MLTDNRSLFQRDIVSTLGKLTNVAAMYTTFNVSTMLSLRRFYALNVPIDMRPYRHVSTLGGTTVFKVKPDHERRIIVDDERTSCGLLNNR